MKDKKAEIPVFMTVLLIAAMFAANYGSYQLSAIPSRIYEAYGLTDGQFSNLASGPMIPSIFFSIVCGVMVDKIGVKKVVTLGMILSGIGFLIRVFAGNYSMMLVAVMLMGFFGMVLNANVSKICAGVYPPDKVGTMVGILMAASTASMAVAFGTTAMIPTLSMVYWIATVLVIVILVIWVVTVKESTFAKAAPEEDAVPVLEALKVSAKSVNIWLLGFALMFMMGGAMVLSNFQVAALSALKGYDETTAGTYATVLNTCSLIGSILIPIAASKMKKKTGLFIFITTAIAAASCVGIVALPSAGIYISSALNGALRSGTIAVALSMPVMLKEIGPKYAGTAGGFVVTIELFGAVVIPTYVVVPLAGAGNYYTFFVMAGVCLLLCAVLMYIVIRRSKVFD